MVKIKMKLSLIFSTCFLAVLAFGDLDSSTNPTPNSSPSPTELFKALEDRSQELEKSHQEFKDLKESHEKSQEEFKVLKTSCEKSQEELKKQVESLKEEVEKLKQGILENEGVGMLRPPLRGPPGRKGEMGDQGLIGSKGDRGEKGEKGPPGQLGSHGNSGRDGKAGERGPAGSKGDRGVSALQSITSCSDAMEISPSSRSKKQVIYPHGNSRSLEVLCDFENDGGGWTIIQKRSSGPKDEFNKTWTEYANGFGSLDKNFWIGLENIRALTKNGDQELRIELEDFEGNKRHAKYSSFSVSGASDFYRLSISGYSGYAGNDMIFSSVPDRVHNGMQFSTNDKDNDKSSMNCAEYYSGGGWWFNSCRSADLNGLYFEKGETVPGYKGIYWFSWKGWEYSLAKTEMKTRKRK